jgi:hypothetical protein
MTTVVWTAKVVPLDTHESWSISDFAAASERPWRIPVLINHDPALEVGPLYLIRERAGWLEADLTLDDTPLGREAAERMRIGQPVSVGARELMGNVPLRWVRELSLVERAAVPGAQVIGRREHRSSTTMPPAATTRAAAGEVIYGGPVIRRPGIGQVLRVR